MADQDTNTHNLVWIDYYGTYIGNLVTIMEHVQSKYCVVINLKAILSVKNKVCKGKETVKV